MNLSCKPYIAIPMGDAAGIGPEIIMKSHAYEQLCEFCCPIVIGDKIILEREITNLSLDLTINVIDENILRRNDCIDNKGIYLIDINDRGGRDIEAGKVSADAGRLAVKSIIKSVKLAQDGICNAVTTPPINKEAINKGGYEFSGHTELLADITRSQDPVMIFAGSDINIALATTHLALKDVSAAINKEKLKNTLNIINDNFYLFGRKYPSIGVCALNPHGGEGGIFGSEEIDHIIPAVKEGKEEGLKVSGPFPADTVFTEDEIKKFDVILAMYHDQGMIPVKMASFRNAVNVTLGIPIIRTSVDHGTAFNIAGKGVADHSSLTKALRLASLMSLNK